MNIAANSTIDRQQAGDEMYALAAEMFPWHRAMTGAGLRQTLERIAQEIPLTIHDVATGTPVLDFQIPEEWGIRDAAVSDLSGERVIDYRRSNLHLMSHSQPVCREMTWRELEPHLHSLPDRPDWIPYRTAFFRAEWGFCLSHRDRLELAARGPDCVYRVWIDAEQRPGALHYGECFLPGQTEQEVLISTHVCHPSLANDNLSGVAVAIALAQQIARWPVRRFGYRFLFAPATIGVLAWLSRNQACASRVQHGLVLAQLGDRGPLVYKRSRRQHASIDHAMLRVLRNRNQPYAVRDFTPWGYDERQFCSPGFDLPMGRLTRTPDGEYPEYHTSADDLALIRPECLADSWECCLEALQLLEADPVYLGTQPYGEPQLGPRNLYAGYGRSGLTPELQRAVLWVLNLADGRHGLVDIAERSGLEDSLLAEAVQLLLEHQLIREANPATLSSIPKLSDQDTPADRDHGFASASNLNRCQVSN